MSTLTRTDWMCIGILACVIGTVGCRSSQMASRVDVSSIRSIKIGMTQEQVTAILGQPLRIRPWGPNAFIYDYAIPGWAFSGPGLWIHFEKGAVRTVHGRQHRIIGDDQAVYEARADRPIFEHHDFEPTFSRKRSH